MRMLWVVRRVGLNYEMQAMSISGCMYVIEGI